MNGADRFSCGMCTTAKLETPPPPIFGQPVGGFTGSSVADEYEREKELFEKYEKEKQDKEGHISSSSSKKGIIG